MDKDRFSQLLIDPNEIYFEDFLVDLVISKQISKKGRLKLCSKSLVFEPKDGKTPLIRILYKYCDQILKCSMNENSLKIKCSQYIEMLDGNRIEPYKFVEKVHNFLFKFLYANVDDHTADILQLKRASTLNIYEQNSMIATIVYSRHVRIKFDPLWYEDFSETKIIDYRVDEIKPLILNPGRLLLTERCIYFQPYNNIRPFPVMKIPLDKITSVMKRRYLLRQVGMEIKWSINNLLYVSFKNGEERDAFYNEILAQENYQVEPKESDYMTLKWQNGLISNYDYLLYLNSLADRTFEDLTQYPVFPWVICNYNSDDLDLNDITNYRDLSKPIGALNLERLERLKERMNEMGEPKFLYGSHYSAPGLILFYLVRKYPHLMLCLQNGRFDHPDRMFNSLLDTFNNCLNNMSDFKELIPEFYDIEGKGDFLRNSLNINFGERFNGTPVNHVQLPVWAKNSPELFVQKLREALESPYVSSNLHKWIDLIFGYQQRGDEAISANNLFYHLCYEGSVDLDNVKDYAARHALEVQISEFGQVPKQLFFVPHVPRKLNVSSNSVFQEIALECNDVNNFNLIATFQSHKSSITQVYFDLENEDLITSVSRDCTMKCYNVAEKKQIRSISVSKVPLSAAIKIPKTSIYVLGSWDDYIYIYDIDYGRIDECFCAHDDSVSKLCLIEELGILISASWDCSIKIWKGFTAEKISTFRFTDSFENYLSLDEKITDICVCNRNTHICIGIGCQDGELHLWKLDLPLVNDNNILKKNILRHKSQIMSVKFDPNGNKLAACSTDGFLSVVDVETHMILVSKQFDNGHALTAIDWTLSPNILLIGTDRGEIIYWDMTNAMVYKKIEIIEGGSISSIVTEKRGSTVRILVAGKSNMAANVILLAELTGQ